MYTHTHVYNIDCTVFYIYLYTKRFGYAVVWEQTRPKPANRSVLSWWRVLLLLLLRRQPGGWSARDYYYYYCVRVLLLVVVTSTKIARLEAIVRAELLSAFYCFGKYFKYRLIRTLYIYINIVMKRFRLVVVIITCTTYPKNTRFTRIR